MNIFGPIFLHDNIIAISLTITPIELSYLDGLTNNIQTQINNIIATNNLS